MDYISYSEQYEYEREDISRDYDYEREQERKYEMYGEFDHE